MNFSRFLEKEKRKRKRERLLCCGLSSRAMDQRGWGGVRAATADQVHRVGIGRQRLAAQQCISPISSLPARSGG
jgi:hypothetical protein